jgi:hypothetical protein
MVADAETNSNPQSDRHAGADVAPGDAAPEGTPGTGEAICRSCRGTGTIDQHACENCNGTGKVVEGIGGG